MGSQETQTIEASITAATAAPPSAAEALPPDAAAPVAPAAEPAPAPPKPARTPGAGPAPAAVPAVVLDSDAAVLAYLKSYAEGHYIEPPRRPAESAADDCDSATAASLAHRFGLPLVRLGKIKLDPDLVARVPPVVARRHRLVPIVEHDGVFAVAVENPVDVEIFPALNFVTHQRIALLVAEPQELAHAITEAYDRVEDAEILRHLGLDMAESESAVTSEQEGRRLALEQPIVRLVGDLFADAAQRRASDIHLRPGAEGTDLLYRIDNELVVVRRFVRALNRAIVARVKVLGKMNVAEHRVPQDGRATHVTDSGNEIDLRISIMPTIHGESVVIRLLDKMQGLRSIDQLGLSPQDSTRLLDLIGRSHGMILVTGPTGSGKSTTLYSALLECRKEHVNILTVEDPVEYHIDEVQQMQVNRAAGFTFASALRNILRHDPDVIMLGEIRDRETAQIAVESALTGHLLLSTLHTNTAATTITRLLDLGVESFLLRSTLLGVLSQRLTRRNCPHCREPETVPAHWREMLEVGPDEVFHRGAGCHHCDGLGVRGRAAVYELMVVTPAIRRLIAPHCEADAIQEIALAEGMQSLTQNAVALARSGAISLGEAFRLRAD